MVPSTFLRSKPARCLPVLLATLIFAGCGTHTQDQSAAFMQGTSQANSSFYLQQMQQSTNDSKTNWQLLAIRALLQEGKKQQAIDLFNQLPANLNSTQAREQSLRAVEVKLAQNDYQAARNLLAKIDPTNLEQPQQARYWQAQIDASQGKPSLTLLRALIAQQPLLSDAKQRQKNINATWQALTSMPHDQANALAHLAKLDDEGSLALIVELSRWPEVVEAAGQSLEPHLVAQYLRELAYAFHTWYANTPVLVEQAGLRDARLALALAVRQGLANGLDLLGVSAPERM